MSGSLCLFLSTETSGPLLFRKELKHMLRHRKASTSAGRVGSPFSSRSTWAFLADPLGVGDRDLRRQGEVLLMAGVSGIVTLTLVKEKLGGSGSCCFLHDRITLPACECLSEVLWGLKARRVGRAPSVFIPRRGRGSSSKGRLWRGQADADIELVSAPIPTAWKSSTPTPPHTPPPQTHLLPQV